MNDVEYRVVWRWRERTYGDVEPYFLPVRRKVYKTRAAADRLLTKLQSNGGRYDKAVEVEPTRYDDGLLIEHLVLDHARLEERRVLPWHSVVDVPR